MIMVLIPQVKTAVMILRSSYDHEQIEEDSEYAKNAIFSLEQFAVLIDTINQVNHEETLSSIHTKTFFYIPEEFELCKTVDFEEQVQIQGNECSFINNSDMTSISTPCLE
jgi:hypothetical protein